jgi:ABC-type transport system involved in cytochrome c biogenesis permease subunit
VAFCAVKQKTTMIKKSWWKALTAVLLIYTCIAGFVIKGPHVGNLYGSIRNFFFHVPMWFGMMTLFLVSVVYAIKYLRNPTVNSDIYSREFAKAGIVYGVLGLVTGAVWANYTWGEAWSNDPKQLLAAIALLIFLKSATVLNPAHPLVMVNGKVVPPLFKDASPSSTNLFAKANPDS